MSDPSEQERTGEFLRKFLLGEELVDTQFHLFSARSSSSGRVLKPRVLCANNVILAKRSRYFLDLLSSDINPSDPSLVDLTDDNDVPSNTLIDDYGYGSDSDLDDCDDTIPVASVTTPIANHPSATLSTLFSKIRAKTRSKDDDELPEGFEADSSDMPVKSPELSFSMDKDGAGSVASSETAVQEKGNKILASKTTTYLRSLTSRHVLVKDTAFQTWYTLLNYLHTSKLNFLPLGSTTPGGQPDKSSRSSLDEPRCSAKSMYRLACKVGLDYVRDKAFSYIRSNLTEHNILKELSCSLVSNHPQLLEMELDVLYSHMASAPVVANFPTFAKCIVKLPQGPDIMVGIHARLLKESHPLPVKSVTPGLSSYLRPPEPVNTRWGAAKAGTADGAGLPCVNKQGTRSGLLTNPPEKREFVYSLWAKGGMTLPHAVPSTGKKATWNAVPQAASSGSRQIIFSQFTDDDDNDEDKGEDDEEGGDEEDEEEDDDNEGEDDDEVGEDNDYGYNEGEDDCNDYYEDYGYDEWAPPAADGYGVSD